jgi:hypothetical protein
MGLRRRTTASTSHATPNPAAIISVGVRGSEPDPNGSELPQGTAKPSRQRPTMGYLRIATAATSPTGTAMAYRVGIKVTTAIPAHAVTTSRVRMSVYR